MPAKVAVGVMAFNQERYIARALDSILAQETDFDVDIFVHDDASTDGTRAIIESYVARHPGRFNALLQDENQYSKGRRILPLLLQIMHGDYFALLDGDDYWHDERKLQIQADFLDENTDCVICQTATRYLDEASGDVVRVMPPLNRRRRRHDGGDLARSNFLQTSAIMFRADATPSFPPDYHDLAFGDYPFFSLLTARGWIGYIDEVMVTYLLHATNIWYHRPRRERFEAGLKVVEFLIRHLPPEQRAPWRRAWIARRVIVSLLRRWDRLLACLARGG